MKNPSRKGIAMKNIIDLRSDTVTKPTPEMREAMKNAAVGDDILRDDPTVLELEELGARILGKEAAMFTISGTMSNEVAMMTYSRPGEEIIVHRNSHIYNLETGALAALSGMLLIISGLTASRPASWALRTVR